jgi:hypothetical protein
MDFRLRGNDCAAEPKTFRNDINRAAAVSRLDRTNFRRMVRFTGGHQRGMAFRAMSRAAKPAPSAGNGVFLVPGAASKIAK